MTGRWVKVEPSRHDDSGIRTITFSENAAEPAKAWAVGVGGLDVRRLDGGGADG